MISQKIRKQFNTYEKLYIKKLYIKNSTIELWCFPRDILNQSIHERILEIKHHIKFLDELMYCFYWYMILMTSVIQLSSIILSYFIMGITPPISYILSCLTIICAGTILNFFVSIHWRKMNKLYDMYQERVRTN